MATKKKLLISVAVLLSILIITNPSPKRYREFLGTGKLHNVKRVRNWIIFSVYENNEYYIVDRKTHFAIFMNFFRMK